MSSETRIIISGVDNTGPAIKSVVKGFDDVGRQATQLSGILGSMTGVVSTGLFAAMIRGAIDAADEMNDLSQRTGIAVRDLASYKLAAEQSGTSLDAISRGVKALSVNLLDNSAAFKKISIDTRDVNSAMLRISDLFAAMPDGVEKTAMATQLFGKAGMDLLPMLNLGSRGLEASAAAAGKYADAMERAAPQADQFNDALAVLSMTVDTMGAQLAGAVLPTLNVMASEMSEAATKTGDFSVSTGVLKTVLETVSVVGANVAYVLNQTGREIGGMAAQLAALSTLDFKGFSAIGELMKSDAEAARKEIDALSERLLNPPKIAIPVVSEGGSEQLKKQTEEFKKLYDALKGGEGPSKSAAAEAERLAKALENMRIDDLARRYKEASDEIRAMATAEEKYQKSVRDMLDPLEKRAEALEREVDFYGLTESQIEKTIIARLEEQRVIAAQQDGFETLVENLEKEINARQRIADAASQGEALEASRRASEEAAEAAENAAKKAADDWEKAADKIGDSITDSLMRGFESGKGFAENLRDTVVNMFKTMVLQPVIKATVISGLSTVGLGNGNGGLGTLLGNSSGATAGLGNNNYLGLASNAYSLYSGTGVSGLFGQFAMSSIGQSLGLSGVTATGMGTLGGLGTGLSTSAGGMGLTLGGGTSGLSVGTGLGSGVLQGSTLSGGSTGAVGSVGLSSLGSSFANAIPIIGWIIAGMTAAKGAYEAGYKWQEDGVAQNLLAPSHTFDQKFWGPILGDKTTAILSGSSLSQLILDKVGLGSSTPHAGGIVFSDGKTVTNPRSWEATTAQYSNADEALGAGFARSDWQKRYNQQVADALAPLATGYASILNGVADAFDLEGGYTVGMALSADGEDRARSGFDVLDSAGNSVYDWGNRKFNDDFVDAYNEYAVATAEAVRNVIVDSMDVPQWVGEQLDTLASGFEITALTDMLGQIGTLINTFDTLGLASEDISSELLTLAGGLGALQTEMETYYAAYYSETERFTATLTSYQSAFADLNLAMPETREGFRDLVESLDLTTTSGQTAFAALMDMSGAFATVAATLDSVKASVANAIYGLLDPSEQLVKQQENLAALASKAGIAAPQSARALIELAQSIDYTTDAGLTLAAAMPDLVSAFQATQTSLNAMVQDMTSEAQAAVGIAETALDAARDAAERALEAVYASASSALEAQISNLDALSSTIESALSSNAVDNSLAGYRLAQRGLELALAQMRAGGSVDADSVSDMASRAINPDAGWFASQSDMLRAQARTNATLSEMGGIAGAQKTAAEAALASLTAQYEAQIDALNGIDGTVKTVEQAMRDYYAAQSALNLAQFTLDQIELGQDQLDELNGINTGIDSLADAMQSLNAAIYALALATAQGVTKPVGDYTGANGATYSAATDTWSSAAGAATTQAIKEMLIGLFNTQGTSATFNAATNAGLSVQDIDRIGGMTAGTTAAATSTDLQAALLAANASGGAAGIYNKAKALGLSLSQVDALAGWPSGTASEWAKKNNLPAFASGGYHTGGVRLVGERGPELEVTGPSQILNADLTRRMLGGGSNDAVIAELRAVKAELAAIKAQTEATARNTYSQKQSLDRVVDGDALLTRAA